MRVGVIGAGAVGGTLAALLARAGHDVQVAARGEQFAAIRDRGIHLRGAWGEYTAEVSAAAKLDLGCELIVVATKAQDAGAAIAANAVSAVGVPLVVVQNGLEALPSARRAAPDSDVVGGLAMFAASYLAPGEITVTAAGSVFLGSDFRDHDIPVRYAATVLGEVLPVTVVQNFAGAQWTKLVVNQINALPAITGLSAQQVVAHESLLRILTLSMRETVRVGFAAGITFETLQGLSRRRLAVFSRLPLSLAAHLPLRLVGRMGQTPNPGSTLQSIRRGQATEIDYLNGAVVRAANELGLHAPINTRLVELVHEVERSGTFRSPAETAEQFPVLAR